MKIIEALPNRKVEVEIRFVDDRGLPVYEEGKDINGLPTYHYKIVKLDGTECSKIYRKYTELEYESVIPLTRRYVFYVKNDR